MSIEARQLLEIGGETEKDVAAERVIDLRKGVARANGGRTFICTNDGWVAVEDIIDTDPERVAVLEAILTYQVKPIVGLDTAVRATGLAGIEGA